MNFNLGRNFKKIAFALVLFSLSQPANADDRYGIVVDGKFGYIDGKGKVVIAPAYDGGSEFDRWGAWVKLGGRWGRIDEAGHRTVPAEYEDYQSFDGLESAVVRRNGYYGVIDRFGKIRVDFRFDEIYSASNLPAMAARSQGQWTFIDRTGKKVVSATFDEDEITFDPSASNRAVLGFEYKGKLGFFSLQNGILVDARFEDLELWTKDRFAAKLNGRWGVVDAKGKTVVDFVYDRTNPSFLRPDDTIRVENDGRWATMDATGQIQKPGWIEKRYLPVFPGVWLDNSKESSLRLLNDQFEEISPTPYEAYGWSDEPTIIVLQKGGLWGAVNSRGQPVIPFQYQGLEPARNGLLSVNVDGKWGLINRDGKAILPPRYDNSIRFEAASAVMKLGGKVGLIDEKGQLLVPTEYDTIEPFDQSRTGDRRNTGGLALVQKGDRWGYVNRSGVEVWKPSR